MLLRLTKVGKFYFIYCWNYLTVLVCNFLVCSFQNIFICPCFKRLQFCRISCDYCPRFTSVQKPSVICFFYYATGKEGCKRNIVLTTYDLVISEIYVIVKKLFLKKQMAVMRTVLSFYTCSSKLLFNYCEKIMPTQGYMFLINISYNSFMTRIVYM